MARNQEDLRERERAQLKVLLLLYSLVGCVRACLEFCKRDGYQIWSRVVNQVSRWQCKINTSDDSKLRRRNDGDLQERSKSPPIESSPRPNISRIGQCKINTSDKSKVATPEWWGSARTVKTTIPTESCTRTTTSRTGQSATSGVHVAAHGREKPNAMNSSTRARNGPGLVVNSFLSPLLGGKKRQRKSSLITISFHLLDRGSKDKRSCFGQLFFGLKSQARPYLTRPERCSTWFSSSGGPSRVELLNKLPRSLGLFDETMSSGVGFTSPSNRTRAVVASLI